MLALCCGYPGENCVATSRGKFALNRPRYSPAVLSLKPVCRLLPLVGCRSFPEANTTRYWPGSMVTAGKTHKSGWLGSLLKLQPLRFTGEKPRLYNSIQSCKSPSSSRNPLVLIFEARNSLMIMSPPNSPGCSVQVQLPPPNRLGAD